MNHILEQVQSGDFDPVKMFTGNKDKFLEVKTAIESISNNLTKETCIEFLLSKIIPTAFDKSVNHAARDEAVEIGFHLLQFVNISVLSTKEQENIFNAIEEKYAKTIGELRDNNYSNWDRLWIFLIRLCHEKLHTKMSLANKLLRVVEVAFRNSTSIEQRLKAYDCWTELIDNSSLNKDYMCSAKQIKLLMTPMKAKFSRMPVVIMKRCDTFVYLLEKLQDKATLCLKEFLEFCFGPFEERNDVEKMRQGKSVPEVCIKSTKILIQMIGHSHDESESCIETDDIQLEKPVINNANFTDFADILINSIGECCILLNEWNKDSSSNSIIIKCLWRSLLQLIHESSDEAKRKCCAQITNLLRKLLQRSEYDKHCHMILGNVIELLVTDQAVENLREILFDVTMNLLGRMPIDPCPFNEEEVLKFIDTCFETENGLKFYKIASNYFKNDAKCVNSNTLCEVWLKCNIIVTPSNIANIIWPIRHLQNFKDVKALNSKWTKLYNSECKTETIKVSIMQEMEKLFLENPLLSSNIISFLQLISDAETNSSKDFVAKFMRLIELVLTLPNLSDTDIKKLSSIVLTYCDQKQFFYKSENNDEALDKLCGCLEHIITIHKDYSIVTGLSTCLQEAQPKNLSKFAKRLLTFLEGLMLNEDNSVANNTRKLIELLEIKDSEPESIPLASTRSLRIVNMANVHPKPSKLGDQVSSLKLFGKAIDAPSPLALKGSKLGSSPRTRNRSESKKKKDVSLPISDDKSSDYVKIDTEVKIDLNNLNEHQKEVMKKRREDIPALYEDLTQSLSQSQDFVSIDKIDEATEPTPSIEENSTPKKRKRVSDEESSPRSQRASKRAKLTVEEPTQKIEESPSLIEDNETNEIVEESKSDTKDTGVIEEQVTKTPEETTQRDEIDDSSTQDATSEEIVKQIVAAVEQEFVRKSSRKNKRQSKRRQRVRREHVKSAEISDKSSDKIEESIDENVAKENGDVTSQQESVEKTEDDQVEPNEEEKVVAEGVEEIEEMPLPEERIIRKSSRQVKRRQIEPIITEIRRRRSRSRKVVKSNTATSQVVEENSLNETLEDSLSNVEQKIEEKQTEEETVEDVLSEPKENIEEIDKLEEKHSESQDDDDDEDTTVNESIEDLLARVDRRIEENRRNQSEEDRIAEELAEKARKSKRAARKEKQLVQKTLTEVWAETVPDGNQNQILPASLDKEDEKTKPIINFAEFENQQTSSDKPSDVYEFTGDDDFIIEDLKKSSSKKKKKRITLTRHDYISKRKKKVKKVTKVEEEPIPFHVTADCAAPLPLSESQTLRAVPSHQESETITIVITRSPPDSEKDPKEQSLQSLDVDLPEEAKLSPRRRSRRRLIPAEIPSDAPVNSEDVIESSQAVSDVNVTKRRSSSRNRSRASPKNTPEDVASKQIETSPTIETEIEPFKRRTRSSDSKNTSAQELPETLTIGVTPTEDSHKNNETSVGAVPDKITKPRRMSLTETSQSKVKREKRKKRSKSLDKTYLDSEITFLTDELRKMGPVSEKTKELGESLAETLTVESNSEPLADTLTLSPTRDKTTDDLPSSPITCDTPDRTMELLNNTCDISPITSNQDDLTSTPTPKYSTNEVSNVRVAKLLQMVNSNVQVSNTGRRWFGSKHSPSSSKVRKMRMKKEENLDILTFSREVPSPLSVPASSILKRKFSLEEIAAPSPKRKRVNFSDPAITDKKIFIKDVEEYDTEHNINSTNESSMEDLIDKATDRRAKLGKLFFDTTDREELILSFRDFCDSRFKDVDSGNFKSALKCLVQNLNIPEIVDVVSEFLTNLDSATISEINAAVIASGTSDEIVDKCVVPLIQNADVLDVFLPKLFDVLRNLPDDKLQCFIGEIIKVFGEDRINNLVKEEVTLQQIQDQVYKFDCDKMIALVKEYVSKIEDQKRNEFLLNLMSLASTELPVNKETINCHVGLLQNFVTKMTD